MSESFVPKEKKIDDITYKVVPFPGGTAFEILYDMNQAAGGSIGMLGTGSVETALTQLGGSLGKSGSLDLIHRLLQWTYVEGAVEPIDKTLFNTHFAARLGHLMRVLSFVVEVNFQDFFEECKSAMLTLMKKVNIGVQNLGGSMPESLSKSLTASEQSGS